MIYNIPYIHKYSLIFLWYLFIFQNVGRRMTCAEFIENLSELNEGENFSKDVLKSLYHSIKTAALEWAV